MVSRQSAALSSVTPEFGRNWGADCLKTRLSDYPATCGIQREAEEKN